MNLFSWFKNNNLTEEQRKEIFREEVREFIKDHPNLIKEYIKEEVDENVCARMIKTDIQHSLIQYFSAKVSRELIKSDKIKDLYDEQKLKEAITGQLLANLTGHTRL